MYRILTVIARHLRSCASEPDRGEFGPMAYAVMVSAMVLLALVVAAWGSDIADTFMEQVDSELPAGGD